MVTAFLPRSKHLLLSWLQSPSEVILELKKITFLTVSIVSPSICHEVMGLDAMILVFWMLNLKPTFFKKNFYFYFILLYNTVLVLAYIDMNPPRVYMSSQTWIALPPPTPHHPSGSSPCTSPKHPASCIKHRLAIHFLPDSIHASMSFSQIIPPSLSPTESKRLFYTSVSLLLYDRFLYVIFVFYKSAEFSDEFCLFWGVVFRIVMSYHDIIISWHKISCHLLSVKILILPLQSDSFYYSFPSNYNG